MLLLASLAFLSGPGSAQTKKSAPQKGDAQQPVDWNTKRVAFEIHGQPWSAVLAWFANQAQMSWTSKAGIPVGTFTFVPGQDKWGKPRQYTLTEVFDIINERLQTEHQFIVLRGEMVLTVIFGDCVDEKPYLVPRLNLSELKQRGRTEIVEVVVSPPAGVDAREYLHAKRSLGEFGRVSVDNAQVILRSDAATLRRLLP
jgi:hypothetical protein